MATLPDKGRCFPNITNASLNAFLKSHVSIVPKGFVLGAHGVRVAADTEARELGAPDDILDVQGWWKRSTSRMSDYYSGTNIMRLFHLTELYGQLSFTHLAPGLYDTDESSHISKPIQRFSSLAIPASHIAPPPLNDFPPCVIEVASSDEDDHALGIPSKLREGTRSFITPEFLGQLLRLDVAPSDRPDQLLSKPKASADSSSVGSSDSSSDQSSEKEQDADASSQFSLDCAKCAMHISRYQPGFLCDVDRCDWCLCPTCLPPAKRSEPLNCGNHRRLSRITRVRPTCRRRPVARR